MMFSSPPCKDCKERYLKCHSECPDWAKWKLDEARKSAEADKILKGEKAFQEIQAEKSARIKRRIHNAHARGYCVR